MQNHNSFFCAGWWPFILLPVLLSSIVVFFSWQKIERKVALNAKTILADEFSWAEVENFNRGRDILLSGTAPNALAIEKALAVVRTDTSVRTADFVGQIKPVLKPAQISIRLEGDDVIIKGVVNRNSTKKSIIDSAKRQLGASRVIDQLQVSADTSGAPDISNLFTTASLLSDGAQINIKGNVLTVQGEVKSQDQKNSLITRFASAFSGTVENNLMVVVDLHKQCLDKINVHLSQGTIYFDSGTSAIQTQSGNILSSIYGTLKDCPEFSFLINGHTDNVGSDSANLKLSRERAQAVLDYLVALGLEANRFTANGYGASQPVQSNDSTAGRAQNRRIEFKLKE